MLPRKEPMTKEFIRERRRQAVVHLRELLTNPALSLIFDVCWKRQGKSSSVIGFRICTRGEEPIVEVTDFVGWASGFHYDLEDNLVKVGGLAPLEAAAAITMALEDRLFHDRRKIHHLLRLD